MTQHNVIDAAAHKAAIRKQKERLEERSPALVDRFVLRLPKGLREQIRALSEENHRSMNAEIIMVLEQHVRQKFLHQMQGAQAAPLAAATATGLQDELTRRLEALPPGKKEALLQLLD